jgi:hypothetical protein
MGEKDKGASRPPSEKESTKDRVSALEALVGDRIPALERVMLQAGSSYEDLQDSVGTLEEKVTEQEKGSEVLEGKVSDHEGRLDTLEASYREEIAFLHRRVQELSDMCATLMRANAERGPVPAAKKVKAPPPRSYGGARDAKEVENFIFDMEQYFRVSKLDEDMKIDTASMYLVDDAKLWWRSKYVEIDAGNLVLASWEDFKKLLKDQFYPENTEFMARRKLRTIKHTSSIREYVKEFSACMLEIGNMDETDRVFQFIDGLMDWA